jgi:quercetin dioxygenase-like cupin family protein
VHVLSGRLRLLLPGESFDLEEGDAFTMPGATPHTWLNPSATVHCEVLWALTPAPVTAPPTAVRSPEEAR